VKQSATPVQQPATPVQQPAIPLQQSATPEFIQMFISTKDVMFLPVSQRATPVQQSETRVQQPATPVQQSGTPVQQSATPQFIQMFIPTKEVMVSKKLPSNPHEIWRNGWT